MAGTLPPMALHLETTPHDQAPFVLCPGDPDRAQRVADELLDDARPVTQARGLLGFTGTYCGVPVTVQTTGMGGGSTAIVAHELIELGARVLIRAGTTGGLQEHLQVGDLVIADTVVADDGTARALVGTDPRPSDPEVSDALAAAAQAGDRTVHRGAVVTTDLFYDPEPGRNAAWQARGLLSVEMEAAVLAAVAARNGAVAGSILAVSNTLVGTAPGWADAGVRDAASLDACRVALTAFTRLASRPLSL